MSNAGHRQRLRARFKDAPEKPADYELLELLLERYGEDELDSVEELKDDLPLREVNGICPWLRVFHENGQALSAKHGDPLHEMPEEDRQFGHRQRVDYA